MPEPEVLVAEYQARLDAAASARSRAWWDKYLKGVIPFRGVGLPDNLKLLKAWRAERGLDGWPIQPRALRTEYLGRLRRA